MATLKDVYETIRGHNVSWMILGVTGEWKQTIYDAGRKIGDAVVEDLGISKEQAESLPPETVLGPKAEAAYKGLVTLIDDEIRRITSLNQG